MDENKNVNGEEQVPGSPVQPEPEVTAPVAPVSEDSAFAGAEASEVAAVAPTAPAVSAAPVSENPFAALSAAASAPATASPAIPAPEVTAPAAPVATAGFSPAAVPQQPASATQPYAVYEPTAQPVAGAGQPAYQQASYGAYDQTYAYGGAQPQQPTPPVPPVPPAPVYGYEPPSSGGQKRRWPWFLLGLAVGLVIGLGGCVSCVGIMAASSYDDSYDYDRNRDYGYDDYDYDYDDDYDFSYPPEDDYDLLDEDSSFGTYTYEEIADALEGAGLPAGTPGADGTCAMGYYTVGPDGDIPAGLYYLEGSNDALSHYYIFEYDDNGSDNYELDDAVQYFGNYFAELDDGDLIAYVPGAEVTMRPAPTTSIEPAVPYTNGCYRVGIDIPAGSYTVTALPVSERETTEESAAFVMKDLDFNDDSIVDTQYVIAGGKQVVTVADGQYLELFAAQATPVAQG